MTQVVVSLYGFIAFLMVLIKSKYTLLMLAMVLPFERLFIKTGIPGINILTLIVLPLIWVYLINVKNKKPQYAKYSLDKIIILLMGVTTLTAFMPLIFKATPQYSVHDQIFELKRWFTYFLFFFIYFHGVNSRDLLLKVLLFIALGYSIESLHSFKDFVVHGRDRTYGSLANPNELGTYLSVFWVTLWAAHYNFKDKLWLSRFLKVAFVIGIYCALRTLSRGSYLTLLVTFATLAYYRSKKLFIILLAGTVITVFAYEVILPRFVVDRINQTFEVSDTAFYGQNGNMRLQSESAESRLLFWKSGLKMLAENPILGVGFNQFPTWLPHYGKEYGLGNNRNAHNMYVKMFAEQGIIGFTIFVWFLLYAYRSGTLLMLSNDPALKCLGITFCVIINGISASMMFGDRLLQGAIVGNVFILGGLVKAGLLKLQNQSS